MTAAAEGTCNVPKLQLDEAISRLSWSGDGSRLYIGSRGHQHMIADLDGIRFLPSFERGVSAAAWNSDSSALAVGSPDGHLLVDTDAGRWHVDEGGWIHDLCWSGDLLAVASGESVAVHARDGGLVRRYPLQPGPVMAVTWISGTVGDLVIGTVGGLRIFDPRDASLRDPVSVSASPGAVLALRVSPDGRALACGDLIGDARVLFLESDHECDLGGFPTGVRLLSWTAPATHLAVAGGLDLPVWEVGANDVAPTPVVLSGHTADITALSTATHDDMIATGDADGTVVVWTRTDIWRPSSPLVCRATVADIAWRPDGEVVAVGDDEGNVYFSHP